MTPKELGMNLRLALYALSARHGLDADSANRLALLAGLQEPPTALLRRVAQGVAVLACALGGFGVIVWLAANWDSLGRLRHFALLQSVVVIMCLGAFWRPAWRAPLGLLALLCTGGLFAYFGQTYQTGADPWQLFAVWAVLTLPLCLGARSDVAWTPWVLVAMTGITLWVDAHTTHWWQLESSSFKVHLAALAMVLGLCAVLSPPLRRWTGAGTWAWGLGMGLGVMALTSIALGDLFSSELNHLFYWIVLLMLCGATAALTTDRFYDVYALCITAMGITLLSAFGLFLIILFIVNLNWIIKALILSISICVLLAASVSLVLRCVRKHAAKQETPT
jgi:uncharacterized membrane protein